MSLNREQLPAPTSAHNGDSDDSQENDMDATMQPMLCKPNGQLPAPEQADKWVMEPKIDGWRGIIHVVGDGIVKTYARSGADHSNTLFHVDQAVMDLPADTVLDGEIVGADWNEVQGVMTRGTTAAIIVQTLAYVAFDVIRMGGQDARSLAWEQRREILERLHDQIDEAFQPCVVLNAYGAPSQEAIDEFLKLGMEGVVLKRKDSRYVNGRSPMWTKIKPQETTEAEIIGFKDGKKGGKFDGKVGSFNVVLLDTNVETTAKCGVDAVHDEATRERDGNPKPGDRKWLGTIVEIAHHGWQPTGKVRHPQILRRRDDHEGATTNDVKAPTTTRRTPVSTPTGASGTMRNYNAMGETKLLRCIRELDAGAGDAYDRALSGSGDPAADLEKAKAVARQKGLV